jgi:hypothetical protein
MSAVLDDAGEVEGARKLKALSGVLLLAFKLKGPTYSKDEALAVATKAFNRYTAAIAGYLQGGTERRFASSQPMRQMNMELDLLHTCYHALCGLGSAESAAINRALVIQAKTVERMVAEFEALANDPGGSNLSALSM